MALAPPLSHMLFGSTLGLVEVLAFYGYTVSINYIFFTVRH